jgi:hypothetical protein
MFRSSFCSLYSPFRMRSCIWLVFWEHFFFISRGKNRPFSVLKNRISTQSERTWTTTTRQSHYGIKSNNSQGWHTKSATNPYYCILYCRFVPIFITPSAKFLKTWKVDVYYYGGLERVQVIDFFRGDSAVQDCTWD